MEIKVGEYVRTPLGIAKYLGECDDMPGFYKFDKLDEELWFDDIADIIYENQLDKIVVKHSPNIMDLIEVGDVIKYKELRDWSMYGTKANETYILNLKSQKEVDKFKKCVEDKYIEFVSIVTKEKFAEMEYKL